MSKIDINIKKEHSGRIDKFLISQPELQNHSRAYLQRLIKNGCILVNNKTVKPSYKLKLSDVISGQIETPSIISLKPNFDIKLNILYEDNNIIVIDKPAGLTVHPSHPLKPDQQNTLANALLAYLPEIKNVGENILRPGIIHRLDKDTSGLMIVAKNNQAFHFLKKQFQERRIIKNYIALISGCPKQDHGIIEAPIARSPKNPIKQKISFERNARKAVTEYKVIKKINAKYCLIEASPKTGRTHQIRVHFAYLGHPIAGDTKYGGPKIPNLNRQFLHAAYLKFQLPSDSKSEPNGKDLEIKSELPSELRNILQTLDPVRNSRNNSTILKKID